MSTELLSDTLYWAVEIERALISILWHHPQFLHSVEQELIPEIHLTLPAHQIVFAAISRIYVEGGDIVSWETVTYAICEMPNAFTECGGGAGLNDIFTDANRYPEGPRHPAPLIAEYVRLLKLIAIQRGVDPTAPALRHSAARGLLEINKLATGPKHPAITGTFYAPFPGQYHIKGWPQENDTVNLTGNLARKQNQHASKTEHHHILEHGLWRRT